MDVLGSAILDYQNGISEEIKIIVNGAVDDSMLASIFYREENELNDIETEALKHCCGDILDVGAAGGCHTLILQKNHNVDALEISSKSCQAMTKRGVKSIINKNVFDHKSKKYDTILLLMNGFGINGTVNKTTRLLNHLKTLLKDGGQIIGDSTDIKYMFENGPYVVQKTDRFYYGETTIELHYRNEKTTLPWLYVDSEKMEEIAAASGLKFELLLENEKHNYLARLTF